MIRVRLERVPRRVPVGWGSVVVGVLWLALMTVALAVAARRGADFTLCFFRRATGIPCPTCGATRAAKLLLAGDPAGAFRMNPLLVVAGVVVLALLVLRIGAGRAIRIEAGPAEKVALWAAAAVLVVANWAYLIAFAG